MVKKRLGKITGDLVFWILLFLLWFTVPLSAQAPSVPEPFDAAQNVTHREDPDVPVPPESGTAPYDNNLYNERYPHPDAIDESHPDVEETAVPENNDYEGKEYFNEETLSANTISLDLRGIDLVEFFKLLSKKLNKNIIPSKKVSGRINLFLNNITYEDAFEVVILSQGLAYEIKSNSITLVMTASEYETLYGKKFNEKKQMRLIKLNNTQPKMVFNALIKVKSSIGNVIVDESTGTIILIDIPEKLKVMLGIIEELDKSVAREVFELQYAKATDIKDSISALVTEGTGEVLADERSNTLIVRDLTGNMNKIKQAITILDQETKQVFITAEIVEIELRDRTQFGIEWDKIMKEPSFWGMILSAYFPVTLALDQTISFGTLDGDRFSIAMDFLNTLGDTKTLSSPRIAVTNNEEAVILVGVRQAYVTGTTSQSGESTITSDSVEFVDVGVKLTVVPIINRDGFVTMKMKVEVSNVSSTLTTGSEDEPRSIIPIIATSEAETTIKVKDGSMIMIAGLRKNEDKKDISGIPFLSKIPIIGKYIFSQSDTDTHQTDIIVFLTPHIIKGESMMAWDIKKMEELPKHKRPGNRGYFEPKFKTSSLKSHKQ